MLMFCPTCANVLVVEEGQNCYRFACNTCPYIQSITKKARKGKSGYELSLSVGVNEFKAFPRVHISKRKQFCQVDFHLSKEHRFKFKHSLIKKFRDMAHIDARTTQLIWMSSKKYPKLKEVDDVLGGAAAWENVDSTQETCPKCEHKRAYFMQIQTRSADEPMTTFYKCCNAQCAHRWRE